MSIFSGFRRPKTFTIHGPTTKLMLRLSEVESIVCFPDRLIIHTKAGARHEQGVGSIEEASRIFTKLKELM